MAGVSGVSAAYRIEYTVTPGKKIFIVITDLTYSKNILESDVRKMSSNCHVVCERRTAGSKTMRSHYPWAL
jgi:hypothetical protein